MNINFLKKYFWQDTDSVINPKYKKIVDGHKYWHIVKGKKVLLVAHVDTVQVPKYRGTRNGVIYASGLDDRLGVFLAMNLLRERTDIDVLLTDEEESANSTASLIPAENLAGYNCIIGLDRGGNDFVDYNLANDDLIEAYSRFAPLELGSFSDISFLIDPPCGCINIGIGYQYAHSKFSYAREKDILKAYNDVSLFLNQYQDVKFEKADPFCSENICLKCGEVLDISNSSWYCDKCEEIMNEYDYIYRMAYDD